jgi:hypothetical protein
MADISWKINITTPPSWAKDDVSGMYLFGSRSMAVRDGYKRVDDTEFDVRYKIASHINSETDFDYAAPNCYKLRERLVTNGWQEVEVAGLYHPCSLMKGLFVKQKNGQSVQILMRSNHVMFMTAWESIDPKFWYQYLWKSSPDFEFKRLATKEQKKRITDIISQYYSSVNRVYQWT